MTNKLELQNLKKRKEQLERTIEFIKQNKKKIIEISQNLNNQLNSGRINKKDYEKKLKQALGNKNTEQWLKYYENYLNYYNNQIEICNKLIKPEKTKRIKTISILKFLILIVSISLIISLAFILKPVFIEKTEVFLKPEAYEKPKIILEQAKIIEETFNQLPAIAGKSVKWKLEFNSDSPSGFNINLPSGSKLISVKNEQNQEIEAEASEKLIGKEINVKVREKSKKFQVIYETPAPVIKEEIIGENKKLTITAPIAYSNIFSYTKLPNEIKKEELGKLRLYLIKDGQKKAIRFKAYDTNENNLLDFIEFIAPETGEYELVIEISRAEHLDENKNFISDIYPAVYQLDEIWSKEIKSGEYARVTFKQKLDNSKDITLYPRIVSGNPRIEVYEINETEKIAEFTSLINNTYNKVYLTNLPKEYSQDNFDLKIINGSIEIEHIIDPVYTATLWVNSFNPVSTQWTGVGTSPWLNIPDYPSNYVYATKNNWLHGEFNFLDLPTETTSINSATLYIYINPGTESIQAEVWDGTTWNAFIFSTGGWGWYSASLSSLNTPEKVNNARLRLKSKNIGGWSGQVIVDAAYLSIVYNINHPLQISYIEPIPNQAPIENSIKTINFNVEVSDSDGVNDINDSSVFVEFNKIGETTRAGTCSWQNDIDSNTANYSCSVDMQYYDGAGIWNIKINATDFGNSLVENASTNFIYQDLKAILISPSSLTWPDVIPGSVNQMSDNDPSVVTNTGNHEGPIVIQAKNLYGETRITEFIPADSFTAGTSTGKKDPECDPATSSFLQDSADIIIINSMLNKGVAAQEEIFYCIPQVPLISSQTYSTQQAGSWTITVLIATIIIKKKKKKLEKKQKSDKIEKDNLVISLILLSKEIKQEYSKEKQEIINLLTKEIKKKYKLNNKEIIQLTETKKETTIPISVFKSKIGALEALCKYMKENLNIKYRKIAELLQRNERTIWTAYNKAKQKQPEPIKIEGEKILLPISILNKKLTVLESVIIYLKQQNLRYVEISKLLNRNQRNIWAIYSRAVKKAIE